MTRGRFDDLTGRQFGQLTVLEYAGKSRSGASTWLCRCDCGTEKVAIGASMKNGKTWSCGCTALKKRHGLTKSGEFHPMYLTWRSIKARCTDPGNENWANYGGRGIGMWEPWIDDPAFFCHGVTALLGPKPGPEYSLDRIDNDGDYAPGNIRWATQSQQMRNTRRTVLTPEGVAEIREFVAYFCAKYPGVKPESMVNVIRGKSWVADV